MWTVFLTFGSLYKNEDHFECGKGNNLVVLVDWCKVESPPTYMMSPLTSVLLLLRAAVKNCWKCAVKCSVAFTMPDITFAQINFIPIFFNIIKQT